MADAPSSSKPQPKPVDDKDYYTAMAHFYRGELGRIMVWRQRLDTTTNWAIISATGIITFSLQHQEVPHIIYMLSNLMVFLLLVIEGRRYRYYDAYRARVRMLEAHFLVPVVMRRSEMLEGDWRQLLAEDLLLPSFKIGVRESISRRLKRNYLWIFIILFVSWALKVHMREKSNGGLMNFLQAVQEDQPLSPYLFWTIFAGFYATLLWLLMYSQKERYSSGELGRKLPSGSAWKI
jgi:uncharacterized membrane protein